VDALAADCRGTAPRLAHCRGGVSAHAPRPGARDPEAAADSTGNANSLAHTALPPAILARLAAEGVETLEQWRALGRRRRQLWGITAARVAEIDELARGTPR